MTCIDGTVEESAHDADGDREGGRASQMET